MNNPFILIAEDDVDDRMLLQSAFDENNSGFKIEFVGNGCELIDYLDDLKVEKPLLPRFIIMDLNMPKKDGRETLKEIKQHPLFKKIPVIIFTTTKNENEVNRCYELGANSYIVKPDSFDALRKITETLSSYWLDVASVPRTN
jgi:CheY-like chemotaxis protein